MKRPVVLTIAGSDSSGGAGVQQDLKVFTVLGTYGASVITALTAQDTTGVHGMEPVAPGFVRSQLEAVMSDLQPVVIKTGMLANAGIVEAVAAVLARYRGSHTLVIDPVMVSKSGHVLLDDAGVAAMRELLFPLARVITPNIPEAEILAGCTIRGPFGMRAALKRLCALVPRGSVVLKGGHLEGEDPVDLVAGPGGITELAGRRLSGRNTHGTGCTFSAALAAFIALGQDLVRAAGRAKEFVSLAIEAAFPLGSGTGPTDPFSWVEREASRYDVLVQLERAWALLSERPCGALVPEVQLNIGYALPAASTVEDVAAFPGRIVRLGGGVARVAAPAFGASSHVARIILAAMGIDASSRAAMNIRYDEAFIQKARAQGLAVAGFSRSVEPVEVRNREGSTLAWGVTEAIGGSGHVPDVIFDLGDVGKEPMIRVLGRDPLDVVKKAFRISGLE